MLKGINQLGVPTPEDAEPADTNIYAAFAEKLFGKPSGEMTGLEKALAGTAAALLDPIGTLGLLAGVDVWGLSKPTTYAENPRPVNELMKGLGLPKVVEAELEVTADEGSAEEAAEDA